MKKRFPLLAAALCAGFAAVFSGGLRAAPGDVDPAFDPNASGSVQAMAVQPDGKIVIGGSFTTLQPNGAAGATTRNRIARLNADGSLDTTFDPNANNSVFGVAVQADGKIIVVGNYTILQPNGAATGTLRNYIARLNSDGSLDTAFNPKASNYIYSVAVQADGKILIGGGFTSLQPNGAATATTRYAIARLNADGSLDTAFNPNVGVGSDVVRSMTVQADGKIVIGGGFGTLQPNGAATATTRNDIARLNADGSLDTTFDPNADGVVMSAAVQADGKIVIGGFFNALRPNGAAATTRNRIARLNSNGSLDTTFNPNANGSVYGVTAQADGKTIVGGTFTTLQPNDAATATPRNYLARLNSDGSLDTTFTASAFLSSGGVVNGTAVQTDGRIIVGGTFTTLQSSGNPLATPRNNVDRLANDPVQQKVIATGSTDKATVQLLRSGALPEAQQVTFEVSNNSGTTWTNLAAATRITGGWQVTGYNLGNSNGLIRARARVIGGEYNGSSGLLEVIAAYPTPDIVVEQPKSTVLSPGLSTVDFGETALGVGVTKTFLVRNTGPGALKLYSPTVDGANAGDFIVNTDATNGTVGTDDFTVFSVVFAPANTNGYRSATLHITSNANGTNNPFDVALTGLGLSATSSTGNDGLSDHAKYNLSALGFDYHLSQPALVQALYAGAGTAGLYTAAQVQALNVGTPLIQKDASTGQFKLTIAVKQSANLHTFMPLSLTSGGTTTFNAAGELEFRFTSPGAAQFYRLESR